MEAAAVARRAGATLLARAPAGSCKVRARAWERGVRSAGGGSAQAAGARRRLRVASLGVGEPLPLPAQPLAEDAVALEVDEDGGDDDPSTEDLPLPDADVPEAKTVRVKFVLKKQCAFGQQFLVVGADPALGLWDPNKATALDWSEDHVWTAKTDLPANRSIEFKFLLRDASGHVRWQHGANRVLQTTETTNTLVVHEDWNHSKKQRVLEEEEEEEISIAAEDVAFSDDLSASNGGIPADNLQTDECVENDKSAAAVAVVAIVADETKQPQLVVGEDKTIVQELHGEAEAVPGNGIPSADDCAGTNDDDASLLCPEGAPLANRPANIFENDLAWAGKAMQQMLRILGFQIGTTRT